MKVTFAKDRSGQWWWKTTTDGGEDIAKSTESYHNADDCAHAYELDHQVTIRDGVTVRSRTYSRVWVEGLPTEPSTEQGGTP